MGELLNLQNYLKSVRTDLDKQGLNSFRNNLTTAIRILMDYRMTRPLNNHSIKKLIAYSGTLNLLLIEARNIFNRIEESYLKDSKKFQNKEPNLVGLEKDLINMAFKICELIENNPRINNDMDFLKTLYNRQLDNNLNKRKE